MSENQVKIIVPGRDDDAISNSLRRLTKAIHDAKLADAPGFGLGGEFGYGARFENDVLLMHPYCWCEREDCLWCGGSGCQAEWYKRWELKGDGWPHATTCYQSRYYAEMECYDVESGYRAADEAAFGKHDDPNDRIASMLFGNATVESPIPGLTVTVSMPRKDDAHAAWCKAHDKRGKFEDKLRARLASECGDNWCTCGTQERWKAHYDACDCDWHMGRGIYRFGKAACAPHFWHKPSGSIVRWYKYIGRDMECDLKADWHTIISECRKSITQ